MTKEELETTIKTDVKETARVHAWLGELPKHLIEVMKSWTAVGTTVTITLEKPE